MTVSGPYSVKPPEAAAPAKPTSFSCQYAAPAPVVARGRYRPVILNRTTALLSRSRIWITSPGLTCNSVAAVAGSAAGIGCPAAGAPGQWPVSRTAWAVRPVNAAASAIGTLLPADVAPLSLPEPAPSDSAGWAPAMKPRGSERSALSKRNGTWPSARLSWPGRSLVT